MSMVHAEFPSHQSQFQPSQTALDWGQKPTHQFTEKKTLQSQATTCHGIWVSRGDSAGQSRRFSSLKGNLSIDARGIKRFRLMRTTLCTKEIAGDMSGLIKTNGWWELYIGEAEHANQDTSPPPTPDTWKWILSFWKWNTAGLQTQTVSRERASNLMT